MWPTYPAVMSLDQPMVAWPIQPSSRIHALIRAILRLTMRLSRSS